MPSSSGGLQGHCGVLQEGRWRPWQPTCWRELRGGCTAHGRCRGRTVTAARMVEYERAVHAWTRPDCAVERSCRDRSGVVPVEREAARRRVCRRADLRVHGGPQLSPRSRGVHTGAPVPRRRALREYGPARPVEHPPRAPRDGRGPPDPPGGRAVLRRGARAVEGLADSAHVAVGHRVRLRPEDLRSAADVHVSRRRLGAHARRQPTHPQRRVGVRHAPAARSGHVPRSGPAHGAGRGQAGTSSSS
jgi:hypothetical protein